MKVTNTNPWHFKLRTKVAKQRPRIFSINNFRGFVKPVKHQASRILGFTITSMCQRENVQMCKSSSFIQNKASPPLKFFRGIINMLSNTKQHLSLCRWAFFFFVFIRKTKLGSFAFTKLEKLTNSSGVLKPATVLAQTIHGDRRDWDAAIADTMKRNESPWAPSVSTILLFVSGYIDFSIWGQFLVNSEVVASLFFEMGFVPTLIPLVCFFDLLALESPWLLEISCSGGLGLGHRWIEGMEWLVRLAKLNRGLS